MKINDNKNLLVTYCGRLIPIRLKYCHRVFFFFFIFPFFPTPHPHFGNILSTGYSNPFLALCYIGQMLGILRSEYILREYILVSKNNLERKQLPYYYYVECDRGYSVMVGHQKWPNKEEKLQRETPLNQGKMISQSLGFTSYIKI